MYKNDFKIAIYKEKIEDINNNIKLQIKTFFVTIFFTFIIILMADISIYSKIFMMSLSTTFCIYGFGTPIVKLRRNKWHLQSQIEEEEKGVG